MPDSRRRTCQVCGGHESKVGPISWRGKCVPCAKKRVDRQLDALHDKSGPAYVRWAVGITRAGQAALLDATGESVHTDDRAR